MLNFFKTIYLYREYLLQSVHRDLRKKYKRSALGYFWSMLNPLLMMIVLTFVFSHMMRDVTDNYAVFLFAGMIPWGYFARTTQASLKAISGNMKIIAQLPVPKFLFVIAITLGNLHALVISLLLLVVIALTLGQPVTWHYLLMPLYFVPLFAFTLGLSLCLSAINVFFEDTEHLTTVVIQALYFMCPILYPVSMLPAEVASYLKLNPLFGMIVAFKDLIYFGQTPSLETSLYISITGFMMLVFGIFVFNKTEKKLIYFV